MKTTLALFLFALMASTAAAVEYVTLTNKTRTKTVKPTDLIEIVGSTIFTNQGRIVAKLEFADESTYEIWLAGNGGGIINPPKGNKFTGITSITNKSDDGAITLKITSAQEINAVTPSAVLVLPEGATGNFDVIIESSSDLVKWVPFFSQTVNSDEKQKFFRTRVTKTPAPEPAKK